MVDILVSDPVPQVCLEMMPPDWRLHRLDRPGDPAGLPEQAASRIRAVVGRKVPKQLISALPALEIVGNFGVGYDGVAVDAALARRIRILHTPDVLNDAVAELALGLMLGLARDLPRANHGVRQGQWRQGLGLGSELAGAKAGIVGLGRIGREIAVRLSAMRMDIAWTGRRAKPEPWRYVPDLVQLAEWADWLILALPGSAETRGIVGRDVLEALGPHGRLVNIARGELVDEAALIELLTNGGLGGAALDVFTDEPVRDQRWSGLANVVLSPHIGTATHRTRRRMSEILVQGLAAHFRNELPENLIPECREAAGFNPGS